MALQDVRPARWAGSFYPDTRTELTNLLQLLTQKVQKTSQSIPRSENLKALVVPHAGYMFSGLTAAHMSLALSGRSFEKVIVLGPDHYVGYDHAVICQAKAYQTPLGLVLLHQDAYSLTQESHAFSPISIDQSMEHSIEVVLPFLQHYLREFRLVPVVFGADYDRLYLSGIESLLEKATLLVVSTDLSHYLSYSQAVQWDNQTLDMILDLQVNALRTSSNRACGSCPLCVLLHIARKHHWKPVLLDYRTSGDTLGQKNRVVGYATLAFFGETYMQSHHEKEQQLTSPQGQALVQLARQSIGEYLAIQGCAQKKEALLQTLTDDVFFSNRGTFVTLKMNGSLRGCIGSLVGTQSLLQGVQENAVNAAMRDPRFPTLSSDEFDHIQIEISLLSQPQPLIYSDSEDLINKLRIHVDGVILKKGTAQATFLPQVWEQLPRPEEFLSHLCLKAGLSSSTWKKENLEILTYQVQYFEEE
jgi:hypothetical protein